MVPPRSRSRMGHVLLDARLGGAAIWGGLGCSCVCVQVPDPRPCPPPAPRCMHACPPRWCWLCCGAPHALHCTAQVLESKYMGEAAKLVGGWAGGSVWEGGWVGGFAGGGVLLGGHGHGRLDLPVDPPPRALVTPWGARLCSQLACPAAPAAMHAGVCSSRSAQGRCLPSLVPSGPLPQHQHARTHKHTDTHAHVQALTHGHPPCTRPTLQAEKHSGAFAQEALKYVSRPGPVGLWRAALGDWAVGN